MAHALKDRFESLKERLSVRDGKLGNASPQMLVKKVLATQEQSAVRWPDGDVVYPNAVHVQMGEKPWDAYYARMLADSEKRITAEVAKYLEQHGGGSQVVDVHLSLDPLLGDEAIRVTATFDERLGKPEKTPKLFTRNGESRTPMSTVMIFNGDKSTVESTQPAWEASAAPRTPQAQIRYKDRTFTVENGSTIGCLRHANMPAPTIQLPPAECPGTSHQHGTFSHARGQWTFTNKGTNGTLLMRGGESIPIRGSESHQLQSGDVLFLGCKESRIVFETSTHEA